MSTGRIRSPVIGLTTQIIVASHFLTKFIQRIIQLPTISLMLQQYYFMYSAYVANGGFIFGNFGYKKKKNCFVDLLLNISKVEILTSLRTTEILPFQPQDHKETTDFWLQHVTKGSVSNSSGVSGEARAAHSAVVLNKMLTVMQ